MTQEELDALMGGNLYLDGFEDEMEEEAEIEVNEDVVMNPVAFKEEDYTKESKTKNVGILDIIEGAESDLINSAGSLWELGNTLKVNIDLFKTLTEKFPNIDKFKEQLQNNEKALVAHSEMLALLQSSSDKMKSVKSLAEGQDRHRRKTERMITMIEELSAYMNRSFEDKSGDGEWEDSPEQTSKEERISDVVDVDDIEAFLKSLV